MKTKSVVLAVLFAVLCICVIGAGMLAIRYTQGTSNEGDWLLVLILTAIAILSLVIIRRLY